MSLNCAIESFDRSPGVDLLHKAHMHYRSITSLRGFLDSICASHQTTRFVNSKMNVGYHR